MTDNLDSKPVPLTEAQLKTILADGKTALDSIVAAGGTDPPVGVWQQMYRDIDAALGGAGILSGWISDQEYWFSQAGFVNGDNENIPSGYFLRDVTAIGMNVSGPSNVDVQKASDSIGEQIYADILATGSVPAFWRQLNADIYTAFKGYDSKGIYTYPSLPMGAWGGTFYYWNSPYSPTETPTDTTPPPTALSQFILGDPTANQTFITDYSQDDAGFFLALTYAPRDVGNADSIARAMPPSLTSRIYQHAQLLLSTCWHRSSAYILGMTPINANTRKYGPTRNRAISSRTLIASSLMIIFSCCCSKASSASDTPIPTDERGEIVASYHFTLQKGDEIPVCRAFLDRLNSAEYTGPPYCGIPEKTTVSGFEPLTKQFLSSSEISNLAAPVVVYMRDQAVLEPGAIPGSRYDEQLEIYRRWTLNGLVKAWRFSQPISLNNDGTPDNILMWQEPDCGDATAGPTQLIERSRTLAFVLRPDNQSIDNSKTVAEFGDPQGMYQPPAHGYMRMRHNGFHSIGTHIGIFRFRSIYYIHTFLDPEAVLDLHSKRATIDTLAVANTLIVLARQHGTTEKICQYRMTQIPPELFPPLEPRNY